MSRPTFNRNRLFQPQRSFRPRRAFYRLSALLRRDCRWSPDLSVEGR